jgi:hypothetical protein
MKKLPFGLIALVGLVFVGFGDQFLPTAIGKYSYQTRATLDNMMVGLFPSWRPKTNPNRRTEDAVNNLNQRKQN